MFRSATRQESGVISPRSLPPAPCLFVKQLQGTVDEIGLQIGKKDVLVPDPTADADVRVVEVKIRLDAKHSQQIVGSTNLKVNVVITTDFS